MQTFLEIALSIVLILPIIVIGIFWRKIKKENRENPSRETTN